MSALQVHIRKTIYRTPSGNQPIFDELNLSLEDHSIVTLLGRSGVGKSTLMRIIAGLDLDFEGTIKVHGAVLNGPSRDVGFVFQDNRLLPWKRVWQNVAFAVPRNQAGREKSLAVDAALELVGLEKVGRRWPRELSGGMAKRVAIARALAPKPSILLLDEPFSGLDPGATLVLARHLSQLADLGAATILMVMHDVDEAIRLSERLIVLRGSPARIVMDEALTVSNKDCLSPSYATIRRKCIESFMSERT